MTSVQLFITTLVIVLLAMGIMFHATMSGQSKKSKK